MSAVVDGWRGEGVTVGQVLSALEEVRRGSSFGATRTSVVNLVVVASSASDAERAGSAIAGLGGRHPGRTIVLVPGPVEGSRVNASVSLLGAEVDGHNVWSEHVSLTVCGPLHSHLDSLIEPLTLPDLPVVVWYVSSLPLVSDPLVASADVVLVDSKELGDVGCFPGLAELARRHVVVDLSWGRLRPWRELLASVYRGEATHAEVRGKEGPRHLLAGWLSSRLGLARAVFTLGDARHVSLRLTGPGVSYSVARDGDERLVRAGATVEDGPSFTDVLPLPDESWPWSLAQALTHLERDRVWEQALRAALVFSAPSES